MANTRTYSGSPYPFNLFERLHYSFDPKVPCELADMPHDYRGTLSYILMEALTPRERMIIKWRAEQNKTVEDVASSLGLSKQRVQQCETRALRKMVTGQNRYLLIFGMRQSIIMRKESDLFDFKPIVKDETPIEEIGLSSRAHNALWRNGCRTVEDVKFLTEEDIYGMHYVGKKVGEEIMAAIEKYNLKKE